MIEVSILYYFFYPWIKKWEPAEKEIWSTTERYNSLASQWETILCFMVKWNTSNEENVRFFMNLLIKLTKKYNK